MESTTYSVVPQKDDHPFPVAEKVFSSAVSVAHLRLSEAASLHTKTNHNVNQLDLT